MTARVATPIRGGAQFKEEGRSGLSDLTREAVGVLETAVHKTGRKVPAGREHYAVESDDDL